MSVPSASTPDLTTFYVYLTSGCNCACRHCYFVTNRTVQGDSGKALDPDCLRHAITQALPLGLRHLKWTGGEPTLHPAFRDFLHLQKEFGLAANLETNGLLVDDPLAELMMACGVNQVSVSLDGARAETHDAIRGIQGGYERTLRGIRALTSAGYAPEMILTLQRENVTELDDYLVLAADLGAGAVKFNILQPFSGDTHLAEEGHVLRVTELVELAHRLNVSADVKSTIPVSMDVPWAFRPLSKIVSGDRDGRCNILHILGILPNGEYALCGVGQHLSELAMGTIMASGLAEVWGNHPVLVSLRKGLPGDLQGVCGDCLMKGSCRGSCVANNYQAGADLFAPHWFCQQAVEAGIFPTTRLVKKVDKL